jgi:outer membrane cobalamin receptor
MKTIFPAFVFFFASYSVSGQQKPAGTPGGKGFKMPSVGRVYGKVVDKQTKESIPYASVIIAKGDSVIAGNLTKENGEFDLEDLPFGKFSVKITFLGYTTLTRPILITPQTVEQDLGNMGLVSNDKVLGTVEVVAEKSVSEMNIDRKVFNVDKNITSKGGTAMDVMKNIPSVTLDDNGNAQLRQNPATLYIDGRPTTLTLDQIPADQIDRVEVITNPSAKYEASATGGIINIVMKSNSLPGYNGVVTGGIGTNNRYNGMVALNIKQKPFALSIMYSVKTFSNPVVGHTNRTLLSPGGTPSGYLNTLDSSRFGNTFQTGLVSLDYSINNRNTITLAENIVSGDFRTDDVQHFNVLDGSGGMLSNGLRTTSMHTQFQNYTSKVQYKKTFPKKGQEFTADMNYNTTIVKSPSNYVTSSYLADGTPMPNYPAYQINSGHNLSEMYVFQADYTNPISDSSKIEMGVRSSYRPADQSMDVSVLNANSGTYEADTFLTAHYKIKDLVNAAYVNYSTRWKRLDFMMGLRFEDSYYQGILTDKNTSFEYQYPSKLNNLMDALFPSLFISRKLNDRQEFQFNVSRKINRPNYRQLMPFIMFSDKNDYLIGNPGLTPEFITMAEINFNQRLDKGNLFFTVFYRNTQNPLTPYSYPSPTDPTVLITTTVNGNQSNTVGMDNTFKYELFKNFEATLNMNLFYTVIDASYNTTNFSNQGFNYTGKLNLMYHLPWNLTAQLSGNYESPKIIPQGTTNQIYFADCGLSKDYHKFLTFTLSVSDIFDTKYRGSHLITDQYIQDMVTRRDARYFNFTVMMRFGKADASLFKRKSGPSQNDSEGGFF